MAGLGWLPDTILSRSIIVRMRRRAPDERIEAYRRRVHSPIGEALRRRLAGWAATILDEATKARPNIPAGVEDRAADMWEPLLSVADIAGGDWPKLARDAALALVAVAHDVEPSLNLRLLADLRTVFADAEAMATKKILTELCLLADVPWNDIKGKPITDNQLARRLRQYEVKSKTIRIDTVACKGYLRADLVDVWRRYLPPDKPVADVAPVTSQLFQGVDATAAESSPVIVNPGPLHGAAVATAAMGDVEACNGSGNIKNPHEMGLATAATAFPDDGGRESPGLSSRTIDQLASEVEEWAYANRDTVSTDQEAVIEAEIRRRVIGAGVLPETVAIETERVMTSLFEGRESVRTKQ